MIVNCRFIRYTIVYSEELPTLLKFDIVHIQDGMDPVFLQNIQKDGVILYAAEGWELPPCSGSVGEIYYFLLFYWISFTNAKSRQTVLQRFGGFYLSECDKKDTLFFYSFGFRILDTSVTCRFSFFIQPFDFLLLLWNFNFLKFMCHWFLPQKPICNVMYILYIYNTPSYIVLYSFLLEL